MSTATLVVTGGLVVLLARQLFVLAAVVRSRRFLTAPTPPAAGQPPVFVVVVPVLRETTIIAETVDHLQTIANAHNAPLVVVTTAREDAQPAPGDRPSTAALVAELAAAGKLTHLHQPDPAGLKSDQLNHAAAHCAATLPADIAPERVFLVCYDADSRPPADSLDQFARTVATHPQADVFHQSSRFELRHHPHRPAPERWGRGAAWKVCDGGALRANRFVLGFEVPRLLNRTTAAPTWKRWACSYVYAHITGHGLCIRLSALRALPLPARCPLEDMHYSVILCSRGLPMVPVASLDQAEVPDTPTAQLQQAARWFFGPARALRYLHDPAVRHGPRTQVLAASALGSACEWLGCASVPPLLVIAAWYTYPTGLVIAAAVAAVYAAQLLATEKSLGGRDRLRRRAARLLACPLAAMLFGIGGLLGAIRLVSGGTGVGKTERR